MKRRLHPAPLLLIYALLAVLITWPLSIHLTTHLPEGTDSLLHYWNGWWSWQALKTGQSPFYTPYLNYPDGLSMVYHNFAWLHILPWIPLQAVVGGVAAYNLILLLHLALCGLAAFRLADELTGDRRAALVAGLVYQAWPYRLTQPSHPNMMSTWAIPLFLLLLHRLIQRPRWRDGLLAGLALGLVGYTRWQLLIPAALLGGLYLVFALPGHLYRRQAGALLLAAATAAVVLAPPMVLLAAEWRRNPAELILPAEETVMQTDLLAYLTPAGSHPLLGRVTEPLYQHYYPDRGSRSCFSPYLGVVAILLAAWGAVKAGRRRSLPWLGMGLVLIWLALGPSLRVNGRQLAGWPMLYNLADRLVLFRLLREPDRYNMFLALPVSVLVAYGLRHLSAALPGRRSALVPAAASAAILFEYLAVPLPLQPAAVSPIYARLAAEPGDLAVLDLPLDPYESKRYMFAQVVHRRPILLGHASRLPQGAFRYLDSRPWLADMRRFDQVPPEQQDVSRQLAALARDGIRYVILHRELIQPEFLDKWRAYFAMSPRFEDQEVLVYPTRPEAGRDFTIRAELAPGLGPIDWQLSAACLTPGEVLAVDVAWGALDPPRLEPRLEMTLIPQDGPAAPGIILPLSDRPAARWGQNAIVQGYYAWSTPADLSLGQARLVLALVDPVTGQRQGPAAVIGTVTVQDTPCAYPTPPEAVPSGALFGDVLRLLGYRLQRDGANLSLTLYWRSEQRMQIAYKVFVHLFDPADGVPVAQDDAMPRRWSYPTTLWGPGEVVSDDVPLSLAAVPAGAYGLAVGVYDPASGERLPLVDGAGHAVKDGRLVLPQEVVCP